MKIIQLVAGHLPNLVQHPQLRKAYHNYYRLSSDNDMLFFVQVVCIGDEAFQNKQRLESLTWNLYKYEPTPDDDHVNKKDEL